MATVSMDKVNKVYENGFHANRVLAEGAVDKDEAAAVKDGEGVARVAANTPVKPGDKLPFAVDIEDMQFFDTETDLAIRDHPEG